MARQVAGKIISTAAQAVISDKNSAAGITGQLLSDPVSISQELNYLAKQPDVRELFHDATNYRTMVNGTPEEIMELPDFQKLVNDNEAMDFLSKAGLAGNTPEEQQATLAKNFSMYTKNIDKIKNTPEYRDIITDPEITATLKTGNYVGLLTNEKVRLLAEMLTHGSSTSNANASAAASTNTNVTNIDGTKNNSFFDGGISQKVYRWKDKKGNTHYTGASPLPTEVSGDIVEVSH
jgi:hypothetical protein